jgi:hypothetical protein
VRQAFRHPKTGARCCSFEEITPGFRSPSFFVLIAVIVVSTVISRALTQGSAFKAYPFKMLFSPSMAPAFEFESFTLIAVYRPRASAGGRREERYGQSKSNNGKDV